MKLFIHGQKPTRPHLWLAAILFTAVGNQAGAALPIDSKQPEIYHGGWIDFNKNGRKDVFEDPKQPTDKRVEDLLAQMNVEEKTCQLATLYAIGACSKIRCLRPDGKTKFGRTG